MENQKECRFCKHSDSKRRCCGKIRCKKLHEYVDSFGVCIYYDDGSLDELLNKFLKSSFH